MDAEPLSSADIRLLNALGFVATGASMHRQAARLFESLEVIRPARAFPYVGLAASCLNRADAAGAVQALERGLRMTNGATKAEPADSDTREDRALLMAWLGLALSAARHEAASLQSLKAARALDPDGPGGRLAASLLGLAVSHE